MGNDYKVPTLYNGYETYINLDNAATTAPFKRVMDKLNEFSNVYSSIHRGNGFKSLLTSQVYEEARSIALQFIKANPNDNTAIFVRNSTEGINMLAQLYQLGKDDIIISSYMEHHSNDLPWRNKATVKYINVTSNGEIDLKHYAELISKYQGKIKLVSITGASNVTSYINPIHKIAQHAHEVGAKVLVDASQLVPHRQIDIRANSEVSHIDFIVYTSHKLYSPFGIGVLVGPRDFFNNAEPDITGGGTVKIVTNEEVYWEETPSRNEAGTPNVMGAIALASAIKEIQKISYNSIEEQEQGLTNYLLDGLKRIESVKIYGSSENDNVKRLGVVSFNIKGVPHALVSSILAYEYGIGVRNGCFCAHPYVLKLLNVNKGEVSKHKKNILDGDKSQVPGLVRVSIGLQNTFEDIDKLLFALKNIEQGLYSNNYFMDYKTGSYYPNEWNINYNEYFSFN